MLRKDIQHILNAYLNKKNTPQQKKALRQWFSSLVQKPLPHKKEEQELIRQKIWQHIEVATTIQQPVSSRRNTKLTWRIAISAAAMVLLTFGLYHYVQDATQVYRTGAHETKNITLADGSTLLLEPNSLVKIDSDFSSDTSRTVQLVSGQVFFQVKKDPTRPFRVQGSTMHTEVLGTSFSIRAYENEALWHIAVKTGKVAVSSVHEPGKHYTLIALDSLVYDKTHDQIKRYAQQATQQPWLLFHEDNFESIAKKLSSKFNITISVEPALRDDHQFSAEFTADDSLEDILDMICLATGTSYRQENGKIHIQSK